MKRNLSVLVLILLGFLIGVKTMAYKVDKEEEIEKKVDPYVRMIEARAFFNQDEHNRGFVYGVRWNQNQISVNRVVGTTWKPVVLLQMPYNVSLK